MLLIVLVILLLIIVILKKELENKIEKSALKVTVSDNDFFMQSVKRENY